MLAVLQGSDKQVSWAKKIRKDKLEQWKSSDPIVFQRIEQVLYSETSASWWITHREKSQSGVLAYIRDGGTTGKASVKSKVPSAAPLQSSSEKKTYVTSNDDSGITRFVGELRDEVTGEVVVDLECPF